LTPLPPTPVAEPAALITAAKTEGKITLYPQLDASIAQAVQAAFQKDYSGITLELVLAPPAPPAISLADLDKGAARADVVLFNDASLKQVTDRNALGKYVPLNSEWISSDLRDKDGLYIESVPAILSVAYNTSVAPKDQAPKAIKDVADPRWKGKLGLPDPRANSDIIDNLLALEKAYGEPFVRQLAAQQLRFYDSATSARDALESGEITIIPLNSIAGVQARKVAGKQVDWVRTADASYFSTFKFMGMAANAPHPNAAKLFEDWFLSPAGMQAQADAGSIPLKPGVRLADPDQSTESKKLVRVVPASDTERKAFLDKYKEFFA
jgi:iron(III) transport system substrate-binding protein